MRKSALISFLCFSLSALTAGSLVFAIPYIHKMKQESDDFAKYVKEYYDNKVASFKIENPYLPEIDISFIGDSLTDGYPVEKYYSQYHVVNRGIGAVTTYGVERRLNCSAYDV